VISHEQAAAQVLRFSGLLGYPSAPEAQDELVDAMRGAAEDQAHARRIVTQWLDENQYGPTPYDIRVTGFATRPVREQERSCAGCNGTGWVYVRRRGRCGYSAVRRCGRCASVAEAGETTVSGKEAAAGR
jgi:hypothetical protein